VARFELGLDRPVIEPWCHVSPLRSRYRSEPDVMLVGLTAFVPDFHVPPTYEG
jgi:hypothetical protein